MSHIVVCWNLHFIVHMSLNYFIYTQLIPWLLLKPSYIHDKLLVFTSAGVSETILILITEQLYWTNAMSW